MINSVRNTVLFLLNKDNRGYVSPLEFDYFAKQAQLEIFEQYFSDYSRAVAAQNSRKKALNYGDSVSHIQNKIDIFTKNDSLTYDTDHFNTPDDLYKLINVVYGGKIVQEVASHKYDMIVNSNLTKPSVTYPIYKRIDNSLFVSPDSITTTVSANYIRKPQDPHWGHTMLAGDPVYNEDSSTDFEISASDETELVIKICKFAGLSIREADVVQLATNEEQNNFVKENS
jgi:hypothetical protein